MEMMKGAFLVCLVVLAVRTPQAPPAVSDLVRLQLENTGLKQQLALAAAQRDVCTGALAPTTYQQSAAALQAQLVDIVTRFETDHPGWTIDPKTQAVTAKQKE